MHIHIHILQTHIDFLFKHSLSTHRLSVSTNTYFTFYTHKHSHSTAHIHTLSMHTHSVPTHIHFLHLVSYSTPFHFLLLLLLSRFSRVWLCATPEMAAHQAPLSLGFSRQEHWSGLPFPSPMRESEKWKWSCSVVSDSSRPHGLQPTRLLCPWDFPGKSTGVGCHCLYP